MACSDCFNGCPEITSDKCVKYTGIPIPLLGIQTGDSLSYVEQAILGFLTSALDGSGIIPNINTGSSSGISCQLFSSFLPDCKDFSLNDFLIALIKTACNIDYRLTYNVENVLDILQAPYTPGCLSITGTEGTHAVLQAVINLACTIKTDLNALALNLSTNYASTGTQLNQQIQNYLTNIAPTTNKMYLKMVPYVAVPYFGVISGYPTPSNGFDLSGAGQGVWEQVYLCNGDNNTPDLRGRVPVGVTYMGGVKPLDIEVNPANPGTPNYVKNYRTGVNTVTLASSQMPIHSHTAASIPTISPHSHFTVGSTIGTDSTLTTINTVRSATQQYHDTEDYILSGVALPATLGLTNAVTVGMTVATTVDPSTPGGSSHNNIQPGIGCYYIIFIPV